MTKVNAFVKAALAGIDKTKKQLAIESVNEFLDEARTEITVQLAQSNAEVIRSKALLNKAEAKLTKVNAAFEVARTATPSCGTLEGYINSRKFAEGNVEEAEYRLENAKAVVTANEEVVNKYKAIEADLA